MAGYLPRCCEESVRTVFDVHHTASRVWTLLSTWQSTLWNPVEPRMDVENDMERTNCAPWPSFLELWPSFFRRKLAREDLKRISGATFVLFEVRHHQFWIPANFSLIFRSNTQQLIAARKTKFLHKSTFFLGKTTILKLCRLHKNDKVGA